MARVGGRNAWIAWPAGIVCAAVVAVLILLALPGVPGAVTFVGDTLRSARSAPTATPEPSPTPAATCGELYTPELWSSLVWSRDNLLTQRRTPAASTSEAVAASGATVVVTCHWRGRPGQSLETTVSTVTPQGASAVQATLSSQGFGCQVSGDTVHCERTSDGVVEVHDLRGDRWVSSTLTNWMPDGYAAVVASRAFGEEPISRRSTR
jgi:hypothetical protein